MTKLAAGLVVAAGVWAQSAAELASQLKRGQLDPRECYRVRDVAFTRGDDLRFYFTDGYLIFGQPVGGRRISAVFSADSEGGDAEILVMPPSKGERMSLAAYTGSPNLSEHFGSALLLFTDDTAENLHAAIRVRGEPLQAVERGLLLAQEWNPVVSNLSASFAIRLMHHLLKKTPADRGLFYAALQGRRLGNFDVFHDPEQPDQVYLGTLSYRDNRAYYDTWANFPSRPYRTGVRKPPPPEFRMENFRIRALLEPNLHLKVNTQATLTPAQDGLRVLSFDISEGMTVTAARIDGQPAELFTRESLRANLVRQTNSVLFLVLPAQPLKAGQSYRVEFDHEGDVVRHAGRNVYYVGSRANWYPKSGWQFAKFDIAFRYPSHLDIVFPGELKEEFTEGPLRVTRRETGVPIRLAGFNLGQYESVRATRGALSVEVFANKQVEPALVPRVREVLAPLPSVPYGRPPRPALPPPISLPPLPPDPTLRLKRMAEEIAGAYEYLSQSLGPPALPSLMVSPIPGTFGQGFPGLVYLSTLSYLEPADRPALALDSHQQLFFSEILHGHETAHQWWGNVVASATGQDDWLMESLANYSSLMLLEKRKGTKALMSVLDQYKDQLLKKDGDGKTMESAGPIRLGARLQSSQSPVAWHAIVYGKGTWIMHMLRRRMGDPSFLKLLGEICRKYRYQTITAGDFRALAAAVLPKGYADAFFDHWVENTGIPGLELTHGFKAGKLTVTVTQRDVDETVSLHVPVEVRTGPSRGQIHWITTGSDPVTLTIPMRVAPAKVLLDPDGSVLRK